MISLIRALIVAVAIGHGLTPSALDALARCETGGTYDPAIVSADGRYTGLLQEDETFMGHRREWAATQGVDFDPYDAAQQLNYGAEVIVARGAGDWPTCGRIAGFRIRG